MKPVDFGYARAATIDEAVRLLSGNPGAKILAGGQTLGPMLNLRPVRPALLVDITRIGELTRVEDQGKTVVLGAGITHAAIEDGRVPDFTNGFLKHVAQGIAYRAVRNRGTVGGSLAHADPAADWLSAFCALNAEVLIAGKSGARSVAVTGFVTGAMTTGLAHDEIITGIRFEKLSAQSLWGYHKICRKTGEFAEAIGVVVHDPKQCVTRAIAGALGGAPIALATLPALPDVAVWQALLSAAGYRADAYDVQIHAVVLQRAFEQAHRP